MFNDPKVLISIYAAIISTIALVWNITLSIIEKISRFKVKAEFYNMYIDDVVKKPIVGPKTIKVSIVNKNNKIKYIKSINIELPYKTDYGRNCGLVKKKLKFPILVKPEEELIIEYRLNVSAEWMFKNFKSGSCRIYIYDTTNKKYKSQKFDSKRLKEMFDFNKKIGSEIWDMINEN